MVLYIAEFFATALMVTLGLGVISNVHSKGTKGHQSGFMVVATAWGFAVMIPAIIFGGISGNHINPAFTIALAINGQFPWSEVIPYVTAQLLGAFVGALVVWVMYKPFMEQTEEKGEVLGCFGTVPAKGTSKARAFTVEFVGTFILAFGALGITHSPLMGDNKLLAHVAIGFLVWGIVLSLGGITGCALNPARDLMPRLVHMIMPIKGKGKSNWGYAWVPVVAPIVGATVAVFTYFHIFA
ncbi:MIP/aquaporin family protein [Bacillus sp. DX4.1]|uniref:MIP/aquaporin family protein n=1 Tax=Bacillus sp. DX4.1 TaxID=3055867 RepID=UPI0025A04361|nr:MIP/aquaporin family protein [Bacillus sp. DX4.1]MDM5188928.1 MIP/aquaporin family protein [Bacillus sp. DX4.1]